MRRIILQVVLISLATLPVAADEVYKTIDESGRVVFSSQPSSNNDKPAELPAVSRENLDEKINRIKAQTPENCSSHGGVDCSAGPDADGSVICVDGYTDAVLRHRFRCMISKLEKEDLAILGANDEVRTLLELKRIHRATDALYLSVRNVSNVVAFGVQVTFQLEGQGEPLIAKGPTRVEPYGAADYTFSLNMLSKHPDIKQLRETSAQVRCTNCR